MMKKVWTLTGILAAFGILIAMIAGFSGRAVAEEHQNHCICGGNSEAATEANGHICETVTWKPVGTEAEFKAEMKAFDETTHTYLYLTADFNETAALKPGKNQTLHLCLNGHTIIAAKNQRAFELCGPSGAGGFNAHMTVCDCSADKTGEIKANSGTEAITYQGGNVLVARELSFTLFGGTISGGRAKTGGGNIAVDPYNAGRDAKLYIYGGTVKGGMIPSVGTGGGGNISIGGNCQFYMYGGTVSGGRTEDTVGGGNVYLNANAYFELAGGEIKDGFVKATGSGGGNVYVAKDADFRMTGGTLNHGAACNGGNLFINNSTKPVITGGVIKDGITSDSSATMYGGNINLVNAAGLTIRNATVSGGVLPTTGAVSYGGNIALKNTSWMTIENTVVTGGTAIVGGSVSLSGSATMEMTGGTITQGTSVRKGSSGGFGGNVSLSGTSEFTLNSGTISDGYADGAHGGNLAMIGTNVITLNGGTITGGTNNGGSAGGVAAYYQTGNAVLNLNGGTITGNEGGVYMELGTLKVSGAPVVSGNGKEMTLSDPVNFEISGPITSGADIVVPFPIGTEFAESDADYSGAFRSQYESSGARVVYDAATHKYTVEADDYVDLNELTPSEAAAKKLDVYIISGQSNASGSTGLATTAYENRDFNIYKNVHYWAKRINVDQTLNGCTITDYRPVAEGQGFDSSHVGPELGMAQILDPLYEGTDRQAVIFKYAAGGTSVVAHINDDGTWVNNTTNTPKFGTWYPSSMETAASIAMGENRVTNYLTRGWKSTISEFYQDLLSKGYLPENINFISMVWLQGESDRNIPDEYETLFPILMDEFRTYLADMTGNADDANLPLVVNEIASTFGGAGQTNVTNNMKFITMQRELANVIDNYITIPSSDRPLAKLVDGTSVAVGNGDTWHYGYDDIVAIGRMLAEGSLDPDAPRHLHCDCGLGENVGDHTAHATKEWHPIGTPEELYAMGLDKAAASVEDVYLFLTSDIDMPTRILLGANKHLHLCLSGYTIRQTGNSTPFALNAGAEENRNEAIVLTDCTETPGTMMGGQSATLSGFNGGAVYVGKGCTFSLFRANLVGRTIATGDSTKSYNGYGGTVALGSGTPAAQFKMYSGTISGGNAAKGGGNVFIENGTFTMYGGTISGTPGAGNELAIDGPNVYIYSGSFVMKGGTIENGNTTLNGGNVYVAGGSMTMDGGTIQGGYAYKSGGNIYLANGKTFTMNNGSILNGATISGNGFNIQANGITNLNGGTISGRGARGDSGRYSISPGIASARLNINGATINNTIQLVGSGSVTTFDSGTVYGFSVYDGNLVMNGGVLNTGFTTGGTTGTNTATINGGYIKGALKKGTGKKANLVLNGGYYTVDPTATYVSDGRYVFPANVTYSGTKYNYEIAEGSVIETTTRAATGYIGTVGAVTGGGLVKKGANYTLTAPEVSGYKLSGWYEGNTRLDSGAPADTYSAVCSGAATITAVYKVGEAAGFKVEVVGTTDYEISGTKVGTLYESGSEVTVKYTGTGAFRGWTNQSGKLMSRDAEYKFDLSGDTTLTALAGNETSPQILFYTMNYQLLKSEALSALTELPAVPAVSGKKNGVWKSGSAEIGTKAELETLAAGKESVDLLASYEDDDAMVYTVTVNGVLKGESGAPAGWTAYAEGNASFGPANLTATVKLAKPEGAAKNFLYYADAEGNVLSTSAETYVRYREDTTVYAVYADGAAEESEPTLRMITAKKEGTTVYFEALRDVPAGYTLKEQGILFATPSMMTGAAEEALVYNSTECIKFVSSGREANDVTGLTLKNAPVPVLARGYVIYSDGTNEGIVYSEVSTVN